MKRNSIIKAVVLLLAVTFIALPILSCGTGCSKDTTEAPVDTTTPSEDTAGITLDMLKNYKIIVSEDMSSELNSSYTYLIEQIEKYTGVKLSVTDDFIKEGSDIYKINEYEILLGKTNRPESVSFHKTFKTKDYGYAIVGKKLIIAGHTASEISNSVSLFVMNILKNFNTEKEFVIKSDESNIKTGAHSYDTLKIDGVDIYEYSIVYPYPTRNGENNIAQSLCNWIADKYGYVLSIYKDDTEYNGGYEIQIGDTKHITDEMKATKATAQESETKAYIQKHGNLIWLSGNTTTIIESSKSKLLELIKDEIDKDTTVILEASAVYNIKSQQLNLLNYNVRFDFELQKRNPDDVIVSIKQQNPDVFGTNETTQKWIDKLKKAFDAEYTCIPGKPADPSDDDASHDSIFFRTADFELIESGTKWMSSTPDRPSKFSQSKHYNTFTYVILKHRESGVSFMYLNTHLVNNNNELPASQDPNREARVLQAGVMLSFISGYTELPIIVAGDFNDGFNGPGPKQMKESGIFSNAYDVAAESILDGGTFVSNKDSDNGPAYTIRTSSVLDHIFVTKGSVTVQKFEAVDNIMNGKYPSDHLPVQVYVTVWQCE